MNKPGFHMVAWFVIIRWFKGRLRSFQADKWMAMYFEHPSVITVNIENI